MKKRTLRVVSGGSLALALLALVAGLPASRVWRASAAAARRAAPRDADAAAWVEQTLRSLSPRERVAQLVVVAAQADFANFEGERFAGLRRQIVELGVGGVLLRGGSPNGVAALTNEMQRLARVPLLVSADYERGLRMQMRNGTPFTTNMAVGATGDPEAARRQGRIIAEEMRAIGVNWLYGPVADINNNPDNPVISIRSFGEDPRRVAEFVAAAVRGVREGGALATAKHFPGHGDTAVDTHIGMAAIRADRARLERVELVPFRAAIAAGVDAVMTAHVALPDVTGDSLPSTLSPRMTTELLRGELKYEGIVVTDSLGMGAVTKGFPGGEAAVRAVIAGADVALTPPDPKAAVDALEAALKSGALTEERVDRSVRRLLAAKYRLGLARQRFVDPAAVNRAVERPEHMRAAARVAEASLTLLRNGGGVLPLDPAHAATTLFVVVAADEDEEEGRVFIPQVQRRARGARVLRVGPRAGAAEHEAVLAEAARAERIVVAPFVKRAASKGTVALPEAQAALVRRLIATKKPLAVVAFAGPYLIRQFEDAPAYVVAYAIEEVAQAAVARAIFGETPLTGRLPVTVPGIFKLGDGLTLAARR